jgi:hypothetical protein
MPHLPSQGRHGGFFSSRANTFAVWFVYEGNGGCEGPESRRQDVELQAEYLWESLTTDTC